MQSIADSRLIQHFLEDSARTYPDKCAVIHGDVRLSYDTLNQSANRLASWLIGQGMSHCDRTVLLLENCPEYIISYYGALKTGGAVVPLNPELKFDSLQSLLSDIAPRVIIASARCERILRKIDYIAFSACTILIVKPEINWGGVSQSVTPFDEIISTGPADNPAMQIDEENLASIIFTSGSTGKPKGVMLSHRNIAANTNSIVKYLELSESDIQMVVLPFFYVMGKSLLNTHFAVGGTIIINNKFAYAASIIQQMVDERVTGFSGVPSTYAYLLHRSPFSSFKYKFASLRYCTQAGGHMARHTKEELLNVLPEHTKLFVMYGATEAAARLTYVEPDRIREKIDSIGIPIPDVTMSVLDQNGLVLSKGETGELVASGPNIMIGYWKDPEATANALSRNGYHTGDMGYQDMDGYFHVVGRKDNQLKVGGHRVNPQEIEDSIIATGLIIEAAVLGIEDTLSGYRLAAIVVPLDMCTTERDLLNRCFQLLPRHKLPTEIRFARTLPKNSSGKTDRTRCIELFKMPSQL